MQIQHTTCTSTDGYLLHGLQYFERPSKKIIIFIHGAGSSNVLSLDRILRPLSEHGFNVVAFNNRGSGYVNKIKSSDGKQKKLSGMAYERIAECVDDIEGMITWAIHAGYDQIYLAGHSTGANKIVHFLNSDSSFVKNVKQVVLIAGGDDISLQRARIENPDAYTADIEAQVESGKGSELVPPKDFPGDHPISYASLLELISEGSDYDIFPFARHKEDTAAVLFKKLSSIKVKTSCIYGELDFGTVIPVKNAMEMLENCNSQITTQLITKTGHDFRGGEQELALCVSKNLE